MEIQLNENVQRQLEQTARRLHRDQHTVVEEAVQVYLRKIDDRHLATEARRQSLLANESVPDDFWETIADDSGWQR